MAHGTPWLLATGNPCRFPIAQSVITFAHGLIFFALFVDFYVQAYCRCRRSCRTCGGGGEGEQQQHYSNGVAGKKDQ